MRLHTFMKVLAVYTVGLFGAVWILYPHQHHLVRVPSGHRVVNRSVLRATTRIALNHVWTVDAAGAAIHGTERICVRSAIRTAVHEVTSACVGRSIEQHRWRRPGSPWGIRDSSNNTAWIVAIV